MGKRSIFLLFVVVVIITATGCQVPIHYPEGGYDYPTTVNDSSYYFYPIQKKFSRYDSLRISMWYHLYHAFNEPNLSLAPAKEDIFRIYFADSKSVTTMITLTKEEIVVKRQIGISDLYERDTNRLNELERFHYRYIRYKYPLEGRYAPGTAAKRVADSLIKLYPQLISPVYFKYLLEKLRKPENELEYTIVKKAIPYDEYYRLVSFINSNGYWQMPAKIECDPYIIHPYSYILEANTKHKYNFVWSYSCPDDTTHFANICQEIIKAAGLDTSINLVWSDKGVDTTKSLK